jgi:hypothetical protein
MPWLTLVLGVIAVAKNYLKATDTLHPVRTILQAFDTVQPQQNQTVVQLKLTWSQLRPLIANMPEYQTYIIRMDAYMAAL